MKCPRCKGTGKIDSPDSFPARLLMLRETKGETCKDVERGAGIPHSEYWRLENGRVTNPSVKTLLALARYFGVTTDYMLGLEIHAGEDDEVRASMRAGARRSTARFKL